MEFYQGLEVRVPFSSRPPLLAILSYSKSESSKGLGRGPGVEKRV
jgi:hypothetical protein